MTPAQLLCTGQSPNTGMMEALLPESIVADGPSKGMIRVKRTMQVAVSSDERADAGVSPAACAVGMSAPCEQGEDDENGSDDGDDESDDNDDDEDDADLSVPFPHLFAIGDAADAYGAIKAGHTAYYQVCTSLFSSNVARQTEIGDPGGDCGAKHRPAHRRPDRHATAVQARRARYQDLPRPGA